MNDMSQVIIPKSDQWNADDFIAGPRTFTIREVRITAGSEQPVNIVLEGTDKFYRPCKSMSRVLVGAWGPDASKYVGKSLTLYRDPEVKWGGLAVGGIRISHMSHLDGAKTMVLTATKGSRKPFKVLPLADAPGRPQTQDFTAQLAELKALATPGNMDALGAKWQEIGADARKALAAELPALKAACETPTEDVPFSAGPDEEPDPNANEAHPGKAIADAIIAEINDPATNAVMDVARILTKHELDIAAMLDEDAVRVEVAADKRRQAIRAEQEQAKEGAE
jgi:hypothetical protein